jgi:hypothetical protein
MFKVFRDLLIEAVRLTCYAFQCDPIVLTTVT